RPSGGAWGTSSRLDPDGLEPKIAMDGQGNATAVWYNVSPEYPYGLSGADKPAGKSWTTPREVSSGHLSEEVDLAVGTSGTAAAVVRAYNADEEPTDLPLYGLVRDGLLARVALGAGTGPQPLRHSGIDPVRGSGTHRRRDYHPRSPRRS